VITLLDRRKEGRGKKSPPCASKTGGGGRKWGAIPVPFLRGDKEEQKRRGNTLFWFWFAERGGKATPKILPEKKRSWGPFIIPILLFADGGRGEQVILNPVAKPHRTSRFIRREGEGEPRWDEPPVV